MGSPPAGLDVVLEDSKIQEYSDLADRLEKRYTRYGPGVLYLRRLAGILARPAATLPPLPWLSPRFAHRARVGRVDLEDPLEADVQDLRVRLHRL